MFLIFSSIFFIFVAIFGPRFVKEQAPNWIREVIRNGSIVMALFLILSTSFVIVDADEVGHMKRVFFAKQMKPGQIIAFDGEKGPQAKIIPPGFKFSLLIRVLNEFNTESVVEIPEGKYGYIVARDGLPLRPDQMYADAFPPGEIKKMTEDAAYFLKNGGQKGPQTSVLTPGKYRLNMFLWQVTKLPAKKIEAGHVGVIKSNVYSRVDFGNLKSDKPEKCIPASNVAVHGEELEVPLVPVGCIGVWDTALNPGEYYINENAYTVIDVDTRVQTWKYKGGYENRYINLKVAANGDIEQEAGKEIVPIPADAADSAVFIRVEGWVVPQELRALVQVTPQNAPFVVASVGGLKEVEDRILTPAIKSIVRNVAGGDIMIKKPQLDKEGKAIIDKKTELPVMHLVSRPTKVLDLIENRGVLEDNVERRIKPEGLKAGVDIKEVRFGDPAIPPELLVARQREQLAQQLRKAYEEEQKAQSERIATEKARATADKQPQLVEAEIEVKRSEQFAIARKNEGQGEKDKLSLIAKGQKEQVGVLGEQRVVELRKFELTVGRIFDFVEKNPEVLKIALENAHKFVPERLFTLGSDTGGLAGAAGILGDLLGSEKEKTKQPVQRRPSQR